MPKVTQTVLADGRTELTGGTYEFREAIKGVGGVWDPAGRRWTVPAGADLGFLVAQQPVVVAPVAQVKPLIWPIRRSRTGRCCAAATTEFDAVTPQGPMWWVCAAHGRWKSDYSGC